MRGSMALTPGTKLGPYEIVSPLGAGGMGEVYRAKDTRLDRIVAIKVLPSHLSSSPELKQRFEREAKLISALQHPNICTLHDVGSQDGVGFLVMEYLEGQNLADRLAKGPLPLDQALKIGVEIAEALDKAHQQGIIHRDLKPGNIMLAKSVAKLMDFGLAKPELALGAAASPDLLSPSTPTMNLKSLTSGASPLTQKGSIIGTFQYLAPEVLQGAEADARSDIFAFGCVLYEMATGRRAFEGKSQLSVLTAILEKEPEPVNTREHPVPPMLERIIRACLTKDPAERFQNAHDVAIDLRWVAESSSDAASVRSPAASKTRVFTLAGILVASIIVAAVAGFYSASSAPREPLHVEIPPPDKYQFDATGDNSGAPVLSPQGDKIAFVAHSLTDKSLWVRSLQNATARELEGTQGAAHPFWSPDGKYVGFFINGKLAKIAASGGSVVLLADAPNPRGGSWGANDVILYTPNYLGPLFKVSAEGGGEPVAATVVDKTKHSTHRWPWFLPDGKHFLFLTASHSSGNPRENGIFFGSLDSPDTHMVVSTDSSAQYASGHLLYRASATLVAQPFDSSSGKLSGSPLPLINNVRFDVGVWRSIFAVSQNGLLLYQTETASTAGTRLVWFDRAGKKLTTFDMHETSITDVRLSPDGKRVAFETRNPGSGIWTFDLERNTKTRITFDQQAVAEPAWSPDGKMLVFTVASGLGGGNLDIRTKASDGSGAEKTLSTVPHDYHFPGWSPDGKYLTYLVGVGGKMVSLWAVPADGSGKPFTVLQPPSPQSNLYNYQVSPNNRWVAYVSDESGTNELYVATFPEGKGKWRVSTNGAAYPAWSGNGKELFFRNPTDDVLACTVTVKGSELAFGEPQRLFHASMPGIGNPYDIRADGQRFLINLGEEETPTPLELEINWPTELKK